MVMDSGNYSCSMPNSALSDIVEVSVQQGDHFQQLRPSDSSATVIVSQDSYMVRVIVIVLCLLNDRK